MSTGYQRTILWGGAKFLPFGIAQVVLRRRHPLMKTTLTLLLFVFAAASSLSAQAPTLKIGDPAPALDVAHWIKGDAVTTFEPGQAYIVEFWATWCPPCKDSMPHLSELQAELGDKIVIIGLSDETLDIAKEFLDKPEWAEKTHYTLGADPDGSSHKSFMNAANQNGIPTSFLINGEGKIAWIGHPAVMDGPLYEMLGLKNEQATSEPMGMALDFQALMNQDFESTPAAKNWIAKSDVALREDNTTWQFEMTNMIQIGMSMDSLELSEMKRIGKVTNGGTHGVRVDAKTIMDFPGMPSPMEEPSWVVFQDGVYYLDRAAPMPMMPSMHGKMTVEQAKKLQTEFAGPISSPSAEAMFDKNPIFANPAKTLADILSLSSLAVREIGDTEVVLGGTGSPMLDLNFLGGPEGMKDVKVQLTLDKDTGRPKYLLVGEAESPAFTLTYKAYASFDVVDASLFAIAKDDAAWGDLAQELRAEMEQMRGMMQEGEAMDSTDSENEEF